MEKLNEAATRSAKCRLQSAAYLSAAFFFLANLCFNIDVSGSVHVSVHSRVHVHVCMFSIGPVAECREAYTLKQPAGLVSHRLSSITEPYSYSKFRLLRSVLLGTNTTLQLEQQFNEHVCKP